MEFKLKTDFTDRGDQPAAIKKLSENIRLGKRSQVLLGVTGSGKTYTAARVIQETKLPTLVISHNKTLTAQLYSEFKSFFPENAVEYFVSYYDYYQPEAYIAHSDTYIEKDSAINRQIERLRLKAASALLSRKDVIIVASVSCIYGIGDPQEWRQTLVMLRRGASYPRKKLCMDLTAIQYERNDTEFVNGKFRVRGGVLDVFPAESAGEAVRVRLDGDRIESLSGIDPLTGKKTEDHEFFVVYPATHFVMRREKIDPAVVSIRSELKERLQELNSQKKHLEAQRLKMRTEYDIEMLRETGYTHGIENYSRHFSGRKPGRPPPCLINYFPEKFLTVIDESHVTLPQVRAMYAGDRSRKLNLVEHGFRLPSALDNRPLKFSEFEKLLDRAIYVSATPGPYELGIPGVEVAELIIRPTGLVDPEVEIRPVENQVEDIEREILRAASRGGRVLVTTLTKRMAEDLADFLSARGLKAAYMHSEIDTLERIDILTGLRKGDYDCLIGVNLLREGLDLPEVSLIGILDADKEGFLRSETSLIQVCGRAARNVEGRVIMYADEVTGSISRALDEMGRRRKKQTEYNRKHGITPKSIIKAVRREKEFEVSVKKDAIRHIIPDLPGEYAEAGEGSISLMEKDMKEAAEMLDFELAAAIRDRIIEIKEKTRKKTGKVGS